MSAHKACVQWRRDTDLFDYEHYDRNHEWLFETVTVPASAAPGFLGDGSRVDPEEALVASIAACHMLTFLAIASRKGLVVDSYVDNATGLLANNDAGRLAMTRVTLRPCIDFGGDSQPDESAIERMHAASHRQCFIANSVLCEIVVEPQRGRD